MAMSFAFLLIATVSLQKKKPCKIIATCIEIILKCCPKSACSNPQKVSKILEGLFSVPESVFYKNPDYNEICVTFVDEIFFKNALMGRSKTHQGFFFNPTVVVSKCG